MRTSVVLLRESVWPASSALCGTALLAGVGGVTLGRNAIGPPLVQLAFALLAGSAAAGMDEPSGQVVNVTPTGFGRRVGRRAVALSLPLAVGATLVAGVALRHVRLPLGGLMVTLGGYLAFGFAVAVLARRRVEEPGRWAPTAVVITLVAAPALPQVARWVTFFPGQERSGAMSSTAWWLVAGGASLVAIAVAVASADGRSPHGAGPRRASRTAS
jgi:hypothetical protein